MKKVAQLAVTKASTKNTKLAKAKGAKGVAEITVTPAQKGKWRALPWKELRPGDMFFIPIGYTAGEYAKFPKKKSPMNVLVGWLAQRCRKLAVQGLIFEHRRMVKDGQEGVGVWRIK